MGSRLLTYVASEGASTPLRNVEHDVREAVLGVEVVDELARNQWSEEAVARLKAERLVCPLATERPAVLAMCCGGAPARRARRKAECL